MSLVDYFKGRSGKISIYKSNKDLIPSIRMSMTMMIFTWALRLLKIYLTQIELFQKFDIQQTKMEVKL